MHESDEMFTKMIARFGAKALEKKKEKDFMKHIAAKVDQKPAKFIEPAKTLDLPDLNKLTIAEALVLKRDVSKMPESYQPGYVEQFWYKYWESKNYFHVPAEEALKNDKRYVMVLPPPNVTGYLHLGHGLTSAIEDSLTRIHRQRGYATCYLPGTDHAGIATQSVVEKTLAKQGISKWEMGRDKFMEKMWEWKEKHGTQILEQLRRVGSSLDWQRFHFTMDPQLQKAVTEAFVLMYEKGLIYRATRLVNWSCQLKTAISDIEVTYEDIDKPTKIKVPGHQNEVEFGWLTHFAYKVKDSDEEVIVATTRLETMLGDTAVAVNSQDKRYTHLVGKYLVHPFCDRLIKIVIDDQLVDMAFGTGAVKITPAHDPNDYECGLRNKLEFISIFDEDGKINHNGGKYAGMMRFDCRRQMEQDMKQLGLYRNKTPNPMRLGFCSRSKDVIEPMIKPQWYINCQNIKARMIEVVKNKELILIPSEYENEWFRWMEGLRDWCISRQIWWGHRCPAYLVSVNGSQPDTNKQDDWIVARSPEEALQKAVAKYGVPADQIKLTQDEDVLDTWFSSGLFPFSTFGWPDTTNPDFHAFFPNTILETGWDILFFWVAKMVQFSLEFFDKVPFKYVFLHPLIRDKDGKKMSKSLGNVIDPLEIIDGTTLENLKSKVIEGNLPKEEMQRALKQKEEDFPNGIPECGGDALRFGLLSYMQKTANINLDVKHIIGYRQFCNKIWNSCRFALPKIPQGIKQSELKLENLDLINQWILIKLNQAITSVNTAFDDYEFGQATQAFHQFWLYEFCDIYLEGIKNILSDKSQNEQQKLQTQQTLLAVLDQGFRLLHPMMPYLSEELWQKLPIQKEDSLVIAKYPQANPNLINPEKESDFELVLNISKKLRSIISKFQLPPNVKPDAFTLNLVGDKNIDNLIASQSDVICLLARIKSISVIQQETEQHKQCGVDTLDAKIKLFVNLKDNIDLNKEQERLNKKLNELIKFINALKEKMSKYSDKVPESVKKTDQEKMDKYQSEKALTEQQLASLGK